MFYQHDLTPMPAYRKEVSALIGMLKTKYGLANRTFASDSEDTQEKKGPGETLALPFESRPPVRRSSANEGGNPESRT
jgi:hypothetical protein